MTVYTVGSRALQKSVSPNFPFSRLESNQRDAFLKCKKCNSRFLPYALPAIQNFIGRSCQLSYIASLVKTLRRGTAVPQVPRKGRKSRTSTYVQDRGFRTISFKTPHLSLLSGGKILTKGSVLFNKEPTKTSAQLVFQAARAKTLSFAFIVFCLIYGHRLPSCVSYLRRPIENLVRPIRKRTLLLPWLDTGPCSYDAGTRIQYVYWWTWAESNRRLEPINLNRITTINTGFRLPH